ncbi:hypothetical protein [Prochlorococcus marinus]|uniref:hypothetical protein n=1 Tax=Prochlorococcus marinus TaxID=1219 RepID=UPI001F2132D1|nr:hypothetical protein [Prochlorococcus marinus]
MLAERSGFLSRFKSAFTLRCFAFFNQVKKTSTRLKKSDYLRNLKLSLPQSKRPNYIGKIFLFRGAEASFISGMNRLIAVKITRLQFPRLLISTRSFEITNNNHHKSYQSLLLTGFGHLAGQINLYSPNIIAIIFYR